MKITGRRSLVFAFFLVTVMAVALWAASSQAARPDRPTLPKASGATAVCLAAEDEIEGSDKEIQLGASTFIEKSVGESTRIMADIGERYISKEGLATVPLKIVSIGARATAEGVGETRFWLDPTRPMTSAIWEIAPGTEFPAIQEMRFHFFYTVEAMPGKVFRSMNPARMRSDYVRAFPPLPGTVYDLMEPVDIEDMSEPGVVAGTVLRNRVVISGKEESRKPLNREFENH